SLESNASHTSFVCADPIDPIRPDPTRTSMQTPQFFDEVPPIVVVDPLAEFLGAADDGLFEYRYLDVVKAAGHSCPTVAGAWLTTRKALAHLYPDAPPRRGEIRVEL